MAQSNNYSLRLSADERAYSKGQMECFFAYPYPTSFEYFDVDIDYVKELFNDTNQPLIFPEHLSGGSVFYLHNRYYTAFNFSDNSNSESTDSLKFEVKTSSYSFKAGFNAVARKWEWKRTKRKDSSIVDKSFSLTLSPYIGIRLYRIRYEAYSTKDITLQQYLNSPGIVNQPGIDLRFIQTSFPIGIHLNTISANEFSFGVFFEYLFTFDTHPRLRTKGYRFKDYNGNMPLKSFCFGVGMGYGFSDFSIKPKYRHKRHRY